MSSNREDDAKKISPSVTPPEPLRQVLPAVLPQPPAQDVSEPDKENIGRILLQFRAQLTAEFLGPLPSPDTLARFEQIVPGSAARIIAMSESQTNHRHYLEKTVIEADVRKSWWGLWSGLAIGIAGIMGTVVLGIVGQPWLGAFLAGGTLVSLVSVFVIGTSRRQAERVEKAKAMSETANQASNKVVR